MRLRIIMLIMLTAPALMGQQIAEDTYWLFFTDKENNGYSVDQPYTFLSERSVERRGWQMLPVTEDDLPVTKEYLDSLSSLGLEVIHSSKWLNGALVRTTDAALIDTIYEISFIDSRIWTPDATNTFIPAMPTGSRFEPALDKPPDYSYGLADEQVSLMNLQYLHNLGYTGKGVYIAVLDGGFIDMPDLPAFSKTFEDERIVATRHFVHPGMSVFGDHPHGMYVSSIINGYWPDTLMGSAPDASLLLATTENVASETRIEEYAWIAGAEWADSLGADVINTSLGYTVFDDSTMNYTYDDMNGKTAHISIANSMTAARGIISVTSAGNEGNDQWYYIGAPADAENVIAAGAVDKNRMLAGFSSRGPSADGRVKPDLSAMGSGTAVQALNGAARGSGTSFSAPLLSGGIASLWQAYPTMTASELMDWIMQSADRYDNPDNDYGYGIPSFSKAYYAITSSHPAPLASGKELNLYPNPATDLVRLSLPAQYAGEYMLRLYSIEGKQVYRREIAVPGEMSLPPETAPGLYILEISNETANFKTRIIRK